MELHEALSHFFIFLLLFLVVVVVIVVVCRVVLFLSCFSSCILLIFGFLFFRFLKLIQFLPLRCKCIRISIFVTNYDVIKNSTTLYLPQIKTNESKIVIFIHKIILNIIWIWNLFSFPHSHVGWIGD